MSSRSSNARKSSARLPERQLFRFHPGGFPSDRLPAWTARRSRRAVHAARSRSAREGTVPGMSEHGRQGSRCRPRAARQGGRARARRSRPCACQAPLPPRPGRGARDRRTVRRPLRPVPRRCLATDARRTGRPASASAAAAGPAGQRSYRRPGRPAAGRAAPAPSRPRERPRGSPPMRGGADAPVRPVPGRLERGWWRKVVDPARAANPTDVPGPGAPPHAAQAAGRWSATRPGVAQRARVPPAWPLCPPGCRPLSCRRDRWRSPVAAAVGLPLLECSGSWSHVLRLPEASARCPVQDIALQPPPPARDATPVFPAAAMAAARVPPCGGLPGRLCRMMRDDRGLVPGATDARIPRCRRKKRAQGDADGCLRAPRQPAEGRRRILSQRDTLAPFPDVSAVPAGTTSQPVPENRDQGKVGRWHGVAAQCRRPDPLQVLPFP